MPYGDPNPYGPIWIDPRFLQPHQYGCGWAERTITTNYTQPFAPTQPVDEDRIRKIIREEIADLPLSFDVPDSPPEES